MTAAAAALGLALPGDAEARWLVDPDCAYRSAGTPALAGVADLSRGAATARGWCGAPNYGWSWYPDDPAEPCREENGFECPRTPRFTSGLEEGAQVEGTDATFGFTADPQPAAYQCRLDAVDDEAAWQDCAPPRALTGLAPGPHTFAIRARGPKAAEATAAPNWSAPVVRRWTAGPAVVLEAPKVDPAPPPAPAPPPPPAEPEVCVLPDGFEPRAAAAARPRASFCVPPAACGDQLTFGAVQLKGCIRRAPGNDQNRFDGTGVVRMNGLDIVPVKGAKLVIDKGRQRVSIASAHLVAQPAPFTVGGRTVKLGAMVLATGPLSFDFAKAKYEIAPPPGKLAEWLGIPFLPDLKLEFSPGTTKLTLVAGFEWSKKVKVKPRKLPRSKRAVGVTYVPKKPLGARFDGITTEIELSATNDQGLVISGLKGGFDTISIVAPKMPGRQLTFKNVSYKYDPSGNAWTLEGTMVWPTPPKAKRANLFHVDKELTATLGLARGQISTIGVKVDGLQHPISHGVFWQRGGLEWKAFDPAKKASDPNPATLTGSVGLSFGPRFPANTPPLGRFKLAGQELASIDGQAVATFGDPWTFKISGALRIPGVNTAQSTPGQERANGSLTIGANGSSSFEGSVNWDFAKLGSIGGHVYGWIESDPGEDLVQVAYNAEGDGFVKFFGQPDRAVHMLVSRKGIAACYQQGSSKGGPPAAKAQQYYGGFYYDFAEGKGGWFGENACGLGTFRVLKPSGYGAQAGDGGRRFALPGGAAATVLKVTGRGGAPAVALDGPGGDVTTMTDPEAPVTWVTIREPKAGTWTATTAAGSPEIESIEGAETLPLPKVTGRVRGRGARRKLAWKTANAKGATLRFVEVLRDGTRGTLLRTRRSRGSARLRQSPGPTGMRRVLLLVERGGRVEQTLAVTRYRATAAKPAKKKKKRRAARRRTR